ncbi:inosine triphosphate pyrophosphatase-like protein [Pholiota molesta]|nr:inosine triphosphate pyrophosphatase-like protein [Pholiota molesta]
MSEHVLSHALRIPPIEKLKGKRIVLASNSPRRQEILRTFGIAPEVVPSTFAEDLNISEFPEPHEYPVATATHKAVEVYERLVAENPDEAPDLVIAADTVVLTHPQPITSDVSSTLQPVVNQELLEKPASKEDNLRMLLDMNGNVLYPILTAPGYNTRAIDERTLVYFADNPKYVLDAYVESGEGIDRAGGFAIQGLGGMLIRKIDGDYNNVVGFPAASFFKLLDLLVEEDADFLDI